MQFPGWKMICWGRDFSKKNSRTSWIEISALGYPDVIWSLQHASVCSCCLLHSIRMYSKCTLNFLLSCLFYENYSSTHELKYVTGAESTCLVICHLCTCMIWNEFSHNFLEMLLPVHELSSPECAGTLSWQYTCAFVKSKIGTPHALTHVLIYAQT